MYTKGRAGKFKVRQDRTTTADILVNKDDNGYPDDQLVYLEDNGYGKIYVSFVTYAPPQTTWRQMTFPHTGYVYRTFNFGNTLAYMEVP